VLSDDTKRPNYHDGQYLGPGDFVAEQRYHSDLRRRLSLAQHTWGTFAGLEIVEQEREGDPASVDCFVMPGLAVDGFGREVVVFVPQKIDPGAFVEAGAPAGWVPVWIRYEPELTDPARYGYELCSDPDLAYRTLETYRIEIGDQAVPHDPVVVAGSAVGDADLPADLSVPAQALPDDADDARWLIPLGRVHWNGVDGFIKSTTPEDEGSRAEGRVHGGVVSAHTYAPASDWELVARAGAPARAAGIVRGKLSVEDLTVALGDGLQLHGGSAAFLDSSGADGGRPLTLARADLADGHAELQLQLGSGSPDGNRLVVLAGTAERLTVHDSGDVDINGVLDVEGVVDLAGTDGDRLMFFGSADDDEATAIGLEDGGEVLYGRAASELRWYVGVAADGGGSARMLLDSARVRVRGDLTVGTGGNGTLLARHVNGKSFTSDAQDELFLNWDTAHDVHVGSVATQAALRVHGDLTVGAGSNGTLSARHVKGKSFTSDALGELFLNWDTGLAVHVGRDATPAQLVVHGDLLLGTTKVPVDVITGTFAVPGGPNSGQIDVTSRLGSASAASMAVSPTDFGNGGCSVSVTAVDKLDDNTFRFHLQWTDGGLFDPLNTVSWVAVFVP
jgi:hypothetical protein